MASQRLDSIPLETILEGVLRAVQLAQHSANVESAKLLLEYQKTPALAVFRVPLFTMSGLKAQIRFAVAGIAEPPPGSKEPERLLINLDPKSLRELPAHQVSELAWDISAAAMSVAGLTNG